MNKIKTDPTLNGSSSQCVYYGDNDDDGDGDNNNVMNVNNDFIAIYFNENKSFSSSSF